jgi:foldase protein PrsA
MFAMGAGTHTEVARQVGGKNGKMMLMVAGTAVAILVAGVMVQVLRPPSAFPAAEARPGAAPSGQSNASDQRTTRVAVGRVNGIDISYDELAKECVAREGVTILENMINRKIIQQACDARGIVISEADVSQEIGRIAKKFGIAVDQWLQMLQAERKLTPDQYRREIIWPMLALRQLAGADVTITKQDMQKAFIRNYGKRVKARAIVLDNPRRAADVWEKARANPADFARLARQYSIDPASRPLEGAIPPIARFGGNPTLEEAAFKLKEGEISAVVQIGTNQHIILLCEGFTDQVVENMAEVEEILKQELQEEKTQEAVGKVFAKLKEEARVDNYLTHVSTGGSKEGVASVKSGEIRPVGATAAPRSRTQRSPVSNADGVAPRSSTSGSAPGRVSTAPRRLAPPPPGQ